MTPNALQVLCRLLIYYVIQGITTKTSVVVCTSANFKNIFNPNLVTNEDTEARVWRLGFIYGTAPLLRTSGYDCQLIPCIFMSTEHPRNVF